jgi:hypothetical protein
VAVIVRSVERNLHPAAGLLDAQLKDSAAVQEFLVAIFADPTGRLSRKGSRQLEDNN